MTTLIKIGNSQGIRLPKSIIQQANLSNKNLEFEVVENGLLIKPIEDNPRKNWEDNIKQVLASHKNEDDKALLTEFLDDSDLEDYEW